MVKSLAVRSAVLLALPLTLLPAGAHAEGEEEPQPPPPPASRRSIPPCSRGLKWREVGPYRGGRVAAVTGIARRPQHLLLRRHRRRRLEDDRRRPHLEERLGRLLRRLDRRRRGLRVGPQRRLRGRRRGDGARQRLPRRRHLEVDRRRAGPGSSPASPTRGRSPRIRIHPKDPGPRLRRGAGPRLRPQRDARRLPLEGRRRATGSASSSSTTGWAPST